MTMRVNDDVNYVVLKLDGGIEVSLKIYDEIYHEHFNDSHGIKRWVNRKVHERTGIKNYR